MTTDQIRFNDGAAYERYMGEWSKLAGNKFLEWLAPKPGLRWLDVGCGNGAFTEMLIQHCAPTSVDGIDPSVEQLAYARERLRSSNAKVREGNAMALPFTDDAFDSAVMPLVIFFVPDPSKGVAEMARVVSRGGTVSAYAWDMTDGGFPYSLLQDEMRAMGVDVPVPPSGDASGVDAMNELWAYAGLAAIESFEITVERTFKSINDYWATILGGPSVGPKLASMTAGDLAALKARMGELLPADSDGSITYSARANAIKGIVPE